MSCLQSIYFTLFGEAITKIMLEISLINFLKTGTFDLSNQVYIGMGRDKIIEVLGEPDGDVFPNSKSRFPSIYVYGNIQFHLEPEQKGRLRAIQFIPTREANSHFKISEGFIRENIEYKETLAHLNDESITYKVSANEFSPEYSLIVTTKGGVDIVFAKENESGQYLLYKLNKSVTLPDNKPPEKQVNLSIPLAAYEQLKEMAIQQRKSIRHLCRELIVERLKKEPTEKNKI